ncbi:MAG TPA: hypothetical protein VFP84_30920 [Kofleriaceae bacterium]|nr:hypothetical protein [Kofleriaceae bacterium]
MTVVFEYAALEKEIRSFALSARATGARPAGLSSIEGLEQAIRDLNSIASQDNQKLARWTSSEWAPIETTVSEGAFMRDSYGGRHVYARLTFVWEICNYGPRRQGRYRLFQMCGNCSVRVDLHPEGQPDTTLAMWRFEVGSHDGPGVHFHTQVLGDEALSSELFPHAIDVPRLPSFLLTPTDALEFILGELFQDEWRDRDADDSAEVQNWKTHQQRRLIKVLEFQRDAIANAIGSPWIALKNCKPEADLIVEL